MSALRREYYGLVYKGSDAYPRRERDGVVHPMYGAYAIADYLDQREATGKTRFLAAAVAVADASLGRMRPFRGGLVFWYEPGMVTPRQRRVYSGLAQARYLDGFRRLHEATGERRFGKAAEGVFRSIALPVRRGGVLAQHPAGGTVIEELPEREPSYILNGWLTALVICAEYGAHEFVEESLVALRRLLPLYDLPDEANSLYALHGPRRRPTSFKQFGDARANVYHFVHIRGLRRLFRLTGESLFAMWAARWQGYPSRWPDLYPDVSPREPLGAIW
jgi:hypothetical protein